MFSTIIIDILNTILIRVMYLFHYLGNFKKNVLLCAILYDDIDIKFIDNKIKFK